MMNPVPWLQMTNMISYQGLVRTFPSGQPKLALFRIRDCEFPYAPINEQKIIAEKLDTLLAQVDSTKARLEQIPQILKRFRQAIMASAVEGKLNSSDSKMWKLTKVEDLVRIVNGKSFPSTDYQNNGVKLLRPGNLHKSGIVVWTEKNTTYLPKHWVMKRPELSLKGGVLLMNLTAQSLKDEFLGRVCILNESDEVVLLNQRISAFTSNVKYDIIPYLFIYFRSPQFRAYVDTLDSGTLIKHLNIKDIKSYSLKLPPVEEQYEIVRRVEQLFAYADTIEKQVNNALARVNSLTQSILAKAFRGELTAQWRAENPDLISGENSAAALLEKIKAERAASGGKKTSRKKA
ncbi:restriction endonuclease subunit S [Klebsiella grimontii]|uniref:restriction endonuclease subunit S n=1 Tax=Klebsiella grimontii TaxID=2058152 RepID=UPI003C700F8B